MPALDRAAEALSHPLASDAANVRVARDLPMPSGNAAVDMLVQHWEEIRDEALAARASSPVLSMQRPRDWDEAATISLPRDGWVRAWVPDSGVPNEGWLNFGLVLGTHFLSVNTDTCPKTTQLLQAIPGLNVAGFSLLLPGGAITPHTDWNPKTHTWHLGLSVPDPSQSIVCVKQGLLSSFSDDEEYCGEGEQTSEDQQQQQQQPVVAVVEGAVQEGDEGSTVYGSGVTQLPGLEAAAAAANNHDGLKPFALPPKSTALGALPVVNLRVDGTSGKKVALRNCELFVEKPGKLIRFVDAKEHFAFNHSQGERFVLYLNIDD